jgi:hypothetical protein
MHAQNAWKICNNDDCAQKKMKEAHEKWNFDNKSLFKDTQCHEHENCQGKKDFQKYTKLNTNYVKICLN